MVNSWWHIISVHIPVVGTPILLIWAIANMGVQNAANWKWIYTTGFLLAIVTSISFFTGPSAADWVKLHLENYPIDLVENHALWGRFAFIVQILIGLLSIMAISNYAQNEKTDVKIPFIFLFLLTVNVILLIYTAHLGGMIRRPDLM